MIDYDLELRAHNDRLRAAAAVGHGDRVLDVGCGTGQSTRDAALAAAPGRVLGIDLSASNIERARERTAWASAIDAATCGPAPPPTPAAMSDAFSLGDPAATKRLLDRAGFGDIHLADVREPVFYGHDSATALEWVRGFRSTRDALATLTAADAARALRRLRGTLDEHRTARDGVVFDSRAWLVTARRRPTRNG